MKKAYNSPQVEVIPADMLELLSSSFNVEDLGKDQGITLGDETYDGKFGARGSDWQEDF